MALTPEEQRKLFENRGIIFPENTKEKDAQKIQEIGFYKLKEFSYYYSKNKLNDDELCYNQVDFKDLLTRYYKDKNLRIFLLHAIEDIEVYLNNLVATRLGNKYGAFGYLEFKNWCNRDIKKFDIERKQYFFKKDLLKKVLKSGLPDIKNEKNLDAEGFPSVWIMTDCLTFGNTLHIIEDMSKQNKRYIANKFGCRTNELISWLKCLNFIRNICAHNSDLIDVKISTKPIPPERYKKYLYKTDGGYTNKIAIVVYIVKYLMIHVNPKYKFGNVEDSLWGIAKSDLKLANDLGFYDIESIKKIKS